MATATNTTNYNLDKIDREEQVLGDSVTKLRTIQNGNMDIIDLALHTISLGTGITPIANLAGQVIDVGVTVLSGGAVTTISPTGMTTVTGAVVTPLSAAQVVGGVSYVTVDLTRYTTVSPSTFKAYAWDAAAGTITASVFTTVSATWIAYGTA